MLLLVVESRMKRVHSMLWVLLFSVPVLADELRVRIVAKAQCLDGAQLSVTPEGRKPFLIKTTPDKSSYSVPLPTAWSATVEVTREGCWGDRRLWSSGDGAEVVLRMYGAATVTGEFTGTGAAKVRDARAQVYLRDNAQARDHDDLPLSSLDNSTCTVAESRWRCVVPADVLFDFRLDVAGYASFHHWDVSSALPDLGPHPLVAGASVTGWIADPNGKPLANARVTLFPLESQNTGRAYSAASLRTTRSSRRGFFQLSGLQAGAYRLVSEVPKLSPAMVAEIAPRAGEAVTLPVLQHAELGELVVTLDPPSDRHGKPWTVRLSEAAALYPGRSRDVVSRQADENGRWSEKGLRAAIHELRVLDHRGSMLHRTRVELFDGGRLQLQLTIPQVAVRGVVRAGEQPLEAEVDLTNDTGQRVTVATDVEGRFEGALPAPGTWKPTVLYPLKPMPARLTAEPFVIPADREADAVHEVEIVLPGGRVHGVVAAPDGRNGPAVVHAWRNAAMAAQQRTDDSGRFDFVGLAPGDYHFDAQAAHGSTSEPVIVTVEDEESQEVTLVTAPYARVRGHVVTPDGRPASGAVLQLSIDGVRWERMVADVRGYFERDVPQSVKTAQLIVLTFAYPARMLAAAVTEEPLQIALRGDGGIVRFRSPARISGRGVTAPVHVFRMESRAPFGGQIRIESGLYVLCPSGGPADQCRQLQVQPSSDQTWEFSSAPAGAGAEAAPPL